ncbi:MAG: hypothetical protein AAF500_22465, partial [Myxococcota bacterium]
MTQLNKHAEDCLSGRGRARRRRARVSPKAGTGPAGHGLERELRRPHHVAERQATAEVSNYETKQARRGLS